MTQKQRILVASWITLPALLALSFFVEPDVMMLIVAPFAILSLLNRDKLTAEYLEIPNILEIFERSRIWKAVAFVYIIFLVLSVGYHFSVDRLSVFENANVATMFLGIFAPVLGPIVIAQIAAFRNLGGNDGQS